MVYFSYNDYMDFIKFRGNKVEETSEEYELYDRELLNDLRKNKEITQKFRNKNIVKKLLNKHFDETIKIKDLNNLTYRIFKENDNVILYKITNKEQYILIRVENRINSNISFNVLENCVEIIDYWNKTKNFGSQYPIVIPIIISIGKSNFDKNQNNKIRYITYKNNSIYLKYNVIDINDLKKESVI